MGLRVRAVGIALGVFAAVCAVAVPLASAAKDETTLISRQSDADGGAGADNGGTQASISDDGRFVAFQSDSTNLGGNNAVTDIFVRDTQTNTTTLASRAADIDGDTPGDGNSANPSIAGDGLSVAYQSDARNLGGTDPLPNFTDIYVRGLRPGFGGGSSTLISQTSSGIRGNGFSLNPSISGDGRVVAFESRADNLSTEDDNANNNIFVRDINAGTTTLVSRADGAAGAAANGTSFGISISNDGRWVAFHSQATNLSGADTNTFGDVYVRDLETNTTILVSRQSAADGGLVGNDNSTSPSISGDGQLVTFVSTAANLVADDNDLAANGIYVRDLQANTTTLVSRQSAADGGAPATGSSLDPAISDDGQFVAFLSDSDNLFAGTDDDAARQIYERNLAAETTALASRQTAAEGGAPSAGDSEGPALSADGRYVGYSSVAKNLNAAAVGANPNVFLYDFGPPAVPDTAGPVLGATAKGKLGKPITITVSSDEAADLTAAGSAKPQGKAGKGGGHKLSRKHKALKLGTASASVPAGQSVTLKLKPPKRTAKKLKRAAKAKASIALTATDTSGNVTQKTLKLKLR